MNGSIDRLDGLRLQVSPSLAQYGGSGQLMRDRYAVQRSLGRGGFGVTYLAQNVALPGKPLCVIKQLCPRTNHPDTLRRACKRFEQEAKILSQLGSHAHIPRLLDYFQLNGEFFLVQEYVRGYTLAKEIKHRGPFDETRVKQFLRDLLPIVCYVHQNRVIHRDIKPPNIIRCQDDGRLVLIDFGAVKQVMQEMGTTQRAATTHFIGTLGFAPPEQLTLRPTYASDIFAIGVTCLYLLTAKLPMEFDYDPVTSEINWQAHVQVSSHFANVLDKMLRIAPQERYQSAEEVQRALELEPYLDRLSDCLSIQPPRLSEPEDVPEGYLSPIARTAKAIRQWQRRRRGE
jgi:serine/threonine protein kinase